MACCCTHLGVDRTSEHQVLLDGVEVQTPDGAGVLVVLEDSSFVGTWTVSDDDDSAVVHSRRPRKDFDWIKDIDFARLHSRCDEAFGVSSRWSRPGEAVESVRGVSESLMMPRLII